MCVCVCSGFETRKGSHRVSERGRRHLKDEEQKWMYVCMTQKKMYNTKHKERLSVERKKIRKNDERGIGRPMKEK